MDHMKAVNERFAERYLLGMPAVEAEEFERHYFECEECASAVETGQVFAANAQAVLADMELGELPAKDTSEAPRESFWDVLSSWWATATVMFPAMASLVVLGAVSFYQGVVVIPRLQYAADEPRTPPAFQLTGPSRGEASRVTVPRGTPRIAVLADIQSTVRFPSYLCSLSRGGRTVFDKNADPPADGQPILIEAPAKDLPAGTYELAIYGVDASGKKGEQVAIFAFALEFR